LRSRLALASAPRGGADRSSRWVGRLVAGLAIGLLTFLAFGVLADFRKLGDAMQAFDARVVAPVLALSLVNYGVRAWRWHLYLGVARTPATTATSLSVFLSGLAMSVTPGKLGEVIKVGLMREATGAAPGRTFPVVVTERLADLFAVLLLAGAGVARLGGHLDVLLGGVAMTAALFALLATRPGTRLVFRAAGALLRRKIDATASEEAAEVQRALLGGRLLAIGILTGVVAWFAEAAGMWLVVGALPGGDLGLDRAVLIYALGTLAGALSFLPGGLIATEATLVVLLAEVAFPSLGADEARATAVAATLVIRLATLWFAVLLGVAGLAWARSRLARAGASGS
jgi:uncharacterized membrane protein YbhN (UPF0104 family)